MYDKMLIQALIQLNYAVEHLKTERKPVPPMPRPHIVHICEGVTWPDIEQGTRWNMIKTCDKVIYFSRASNLNAAEKILNNCGHQPRKILRALRRIQAATTWCYARAEGRKRQSEEILRQQASAVEALESEAAMQALS